MGFWERVLIETIANMEDGIARGFLMGAAGVRDGRCTDCGRRIIYSVKEHDGSKLYCNSCAKKHQRGADMFRKDLIPPGWESSLVGNVQVHKDHSTMTFRGKGTDGETYRVSWDGYGNVHWTDEGVPEGHPNRHRDPR